ncbi:pantetheine-phosphate adenylyltransferase [Anaerofilum sp. BX8]|uniref:Phosphopantetheine adenylyltransferase n=1 Tax=Anaerofilum hominis TaxID=2763016 RepID=A0A923I982_9FIRM|nr:pantetheine-phosphate adenylyltransferase [Anaerofilum hominis]MBC5581247.1 pantetheine-phosphate adenylyltransferase [Anaerofilum hominis]
MTTAICPGSYDPVTKGHLDIIQRSAAIFDRVIVLVLINPAKTPTFTVEERVELLRRAVRDIPGLDQGRVEVDSSPGLLVDYAKAHGAKAAVKGLRAVTDFEYEFQQALINKKLYPDFETVFMSCNSHYMYLSSSMVKQIAAEGRDVREFIPASIYEDVMHRVYKPAK